jgi:plasmid replication initiation protein
MSAIKKNYLVKKRNLLNEMRVTDMKLEERRFLAIYLSKINPNDINTRLVRFSLDDFAIIMGLGRLNIKYIKSITDRLLCKIVSIPTENGGYKSFQVFKECTVDKNTEAGEWYIEIDAHDKALPLMFDFKKEYFSYQLGNALQVKSNNQLCMYEILKQYEKAGSRALSVEDLKEKLGIDKNEYKDFNNFRRSVLNVCQKALAKYTDIKFTYEPYGKRGKGGKILYLKFFIKKNDTPIDQISIPDFVNQNRQTIDSSGIDIADENNMLSVYEEKMLFLSQACDNEFSLSEIKVFHDEMVELLPYTTIKDDVQCYNYLLRKFRYMDMQNEKCKVKHRFKYMLSIIGKE